MPKMSRKRWLKKLLNSLYGKEKKEISKEGYHFLQVIRKRFNKKLIGMYHDTGEN